MPHGLHELMKQVVEQMVDGRAVRLTRGEKVVTTQQGAAMLGMSRPSLINLPRLRRDAASSRWQSTPWVFKPVEAQDLRIRSHLDDRVERFVRGKKLAQAQAAKLLGVTQPRVSDLMKGKINLFSVNNLIKAPGQGRAPGRRANPRGGLIV